MSKATIGVVTWLGHLPVGVDHSGGSTGHSDVTRKNENLNFKALKSEPRP